MQELPFLTGLPGAAVWERLRQLASAEQPWTESDLAMTQAVLDEVAQRWSWQVRFGSRSLADDPSSSSHLSGTEPELVGMLLKLIDRLSDAQPPVTEGGRYLGVLARVKKFRDEAMILRVEESKRRVVESLQQRPTHLKVKWFLDNHYSLVGDEEFNNLLQWLVTYPEIAEESRQAVQWHIDWQRSQRESAERWERTDERNTAIARYVLMAGFGCVAGYFVDRQFFSMARQGELPPFLAQLLFIPVGFICGGFFGMVLGAIGNIRPIPVTQQDFAEAKRGVWLIVALALWMGLCIAAIVAVCIVWRAIAGTAENPIAGAVCGLVGVFALGWAIRAWNRRRAKPPAS